MTNDIYLGPSGTETLLPYIGRNPLKIGHIRGERFDRTASFRGVIDISERKKKFTISFDGISEADLNIITGYYELDAPLSLIIYTNTGNNTYTVIMMPFDQERWLATGSGMWKNVSFEFEEA